MVDTLYVNYSQVKLEELDALPREWFHMAHLCDAPAGIPQTVDAMKQIAREGRLYVGEGVINIAEIFDHMPQIPYSIELPNAKRVQELGYEGHARRCLDTAKQYLEKHKRTQAFKASA
jgi:sugar phosphate isomerase/epimerase